MTHFRSSRRRGHLGLDLDYVGSGDRDRPKGVSQVVEWQPTQASELERDRLPAPQAIVVEVGQPTSQDIKSPPR